MQARSLGLDSGFALTARPGMTIANDCNLSFVMAGFMPAIHVLQRLAELRRTKAWMARQARRPSDG